MTVYSVMSLQMMLGSFQFNEFEETQATGMQGSLNISILD